MTMDDELKGVFLSCALPTSWHTFCVVVSNSPPNGKLIYNDIRRALLNEEIHWNLWLHLMVEMHIMYMRLVLTRTNNAVDAKQN